MFAVTLPKREGYNMQDSQTYLNMEPISFSWSVSKDEFGMEHIFRNTGWRTL